MKNKKLDFSEIFKQYVQKFPFRGFIFEHYYFELLKNSNVSDFHEFNHWFSENQDSAMIMQIIIENNELIQLNIEKDDKKWVKNGKLTKPMVPTLKSEEKSISFFSTDTDDD